MPSPCSRSSANLSSSSRSSGASSKRTSPEEGIFRGEEELRSELERRGGVEEGEEARGISAGRGSSAARGSSPARRGAAGRGAAQRREAAGRGVTLRQDEDCGFGRTKVEGFFAKMSWRQLFPDGGSTVVFVRPPLSGNIFRWGRPPPPVTVQKKIHY